MNNWYTANLSEEQKAPFERKNKNVCILAGAGSGKTRTLVHLLAADLVSGIEPSNIVAFTFTNKASDELLARIHMIVMKNMPELDLEGIYIGTIHSWCLQYLRDQSDYYNFSPLDELHIDTLICRLFDILQLQKTYSKPFPKAADDFYKDLEVFYNENLEMDQVPEKIQFSINEFSEILIQNHLMTFWGMVKYTIEHLKSNGPVSNLKSLYVDEYQDVNPAQVELIKSMLPTDGKLTVVGDDLQSIYNWRGSDVTRILKFNEEFEDTSLYRLFKNYRSLPQIIHLGNKVAEDFDQRDPEKVMISGRPKNKCKIIHWISLDSEEAQATAIAEIVEKFAMHGIPFNRIAILLRSVVGSGLPIVDVFSKRGIPFICPVLSRGGAFITEFAIPIFDWLRKEHREPKNETEEEEFELEAQQLWEKASNWITIENAEFVFWEEINNWLASIDGNKNKAYNVRNMLYDFMDACGVRINSNDSNLMIGVGIASQIIRSVEEIHRRRLVGQERRSARGVISEVYFALIRRNQDFGESVSIDTKSDGVQIITIHQAKGLEWPIVIIPMLKNWRFPVRSHSHGSSFPDEIAKRYGTFLEDERRLFFVAITRARERLFLLDPTNQDTSKRSVFLTNLQNKSLIEIEKFENIEDKVWILEEDAIQDQDPVPLRIGLSDLLLHTDCPYQYGLRRVSNIQPSVGDELGFGLGLHELIQRRFEADQPWTADEFKHQVETHVNLPLTSAESEKISRKAIRERLEKLEKMEVFKKEVKPEVKVELLLENGIVYGIIDGIISNNDGTVSIIDWKSNIHEDFLPGYQKQMQFYVFVLSNEDEKVKSASIVDVAASAERNNLVKIDVDISESAVNECVAQLRQSLRDIEDNKFTPKPSKIACASCDVARICNMRYSNGASK